MENLDIDANTSATIITTLLAVLITLILSQLVKGVIAFMKRQALRRLILQSMQSLILKLNKQSKAFKNTAEEEFSFAKDKLRSTRVYTLSEPKSLIEIGHVTTFNALFSGIENIVIWPRLRKAKVKCYRILWQVITAIEYWHLRSLQDFETIIKQNNRYNDKRNAAVTDFQKRMEVLFIQLRMGTLRLFPQERAYAQGLDSIIHSWQQQSDPTRPDQSHKYLVEPAIVLNRQFLNQGQVTPLSPVVLEMNYPLLAAHHHYQNQRNVLEGATKQFWVYHAMFKADARLLRLITPVLKPQWLVGCSCFRRRATEDCLI